MPYRILGTGREPTVESRPEICDVRTCTARRPEYVLVAPIAEGREAVWVCGRHLHLVLDAICAIIGDYGFDGIPTGAVRR